MHMKKLHPGFWILLLCLFVVGCMFGGRPVIDDPQNPIQPVQTRELLPASTMTEITKTTVTGSTKVHVGNNFESCKIGLGLREETREFLLENTDHVGLIMSANSNLAEAYFPLFEDAIRVMGAPSLQILNTKATRAADMDLPYEALGYGLETSVSTPAEEWRNMIASTEEAAVLVNQYDKQLLLAPGFKLMSQNETLYSEMASKADIWILQTQQLQKKPPGPEYRQEVERIISLIRAGNPEIIIWAQITLPPDRKPDAEEWLAYRELIVDLVDGTYIGVYTWDIFEESQLLSEISTIVTSVCMDNLVE